MPKEPVITSVRPLRDVAGLSPPKLDPEKQSAVERVLSTTAEVFKIGPAQLLDRTATTIALGTAVWCLITIAQLNVFEVAELLRTDPQDVVDVRDRAARALQNGKNHQIRTRVAQIKAVLGIQ